MSQTETTETPADMIRSLIHRGEIRLGGLTDIADMLNVQRSNVSTWVHRRFTTGFPAPVHTTRSGSTYDLDEVLRWHEAWLSGHGTGRT